MSQIVNLILDAAVVHYTTELQRKIDVADLARADVVKKGLLQENKTLKNVQIGVTGGDHENPDFQDGIWSLARMPDIGFKPPIREIGGGQVWMRRGVTRIEAFFVRERLTEDEAHVAAYDLLGRVEAQTENIPISGLVDDFGETAIQMFCFGNTFFESGGPPKTYIFRGKVFWLALTERP